MPYQPHTDDDRARMLSALGHRFGRPRSSTTSRQRFAPTASTCPAPEPEQLLSRRRSGWRRATGSTWRRFLGAGVYRHFIPAAVDQVISRGEFATAYTPYQPEVSQGTLQTIYEYQSLIAELTGPAGRLCVALRRRRGHRRGDPDDDPGHRSPARAGRAARSTGTTVDTVAHLLLRRPATSSRSCRRAPTARPTSRRSSARWASRTGRSAGVVLGQPNAFGVLEPMAEAARLAHAAGALFVAVVEPVSLAVLATPGEYGADICAGEGQPLGIAPQYGGPYLGILATTTELMRQIPGRLVGRTLDLEGRRAFVMTLRAREQDIRRDTAASNICTNQALCALAATVYLAVIGPHGLRDVAANGARRRPPAARRRSPTPVRPGSTRRRTSTSSASASRTPRRSTRALLDRGVLAGLPLARWYPGRPRSARRAARLRHGDHHRRRDRAGSPAALRKVLA